MAPSWRALPKRAEPEMLQCQSRVLRVSLWEGVRAVQIKLEFLTECDAQHGAYYLQDRGYSVKLMDKALVVDRPDAADLALVMATYRALTVDLVEGDV